MWRRFAIVVRPVLLMAIVFSILGFWGQSAEPAGLLVADGGFGGVLELKEQDVRVTINNGVAVTEVDQVFFNKEDRIVEALYTFPVPNKASVSNFSMWINGQEMIGEVVEKERARQIYESYKQTRRDPGLLEQVDYKRFEMRVFPIAAGAEQRIRITYYQELDFDHDRAGYVYPLSTVTQKNINERTTGRFSFSIDVKSEAPITELKSPSHADQFVIARHADQHYWQASLETRQGDLSRDVVVSYALARPHTGIDLITSKTGAEDGYFQLTMTAGQELESKLKGSDYVFVVDISGSMMHDGKLALSRDAVGAFVNALNEEDRFELVTFNIAAHPLFGTATPVKPETVTQAVEFLRSQKAMGGTVLRPALEAAYRYHDSDRQLNVVVLSDGMTEQGEQRELLQLIGQRPSGTSVFCVGIGNEVNRPLLDQLATATGGLATFISTGDDFERHAQAFRRKLVRPAATNVKIAFEGGGVYDVEPQKLPNLYHGQPVRLYGRYKTSGAAKVIVRADVLGSPIDQTLAVNLPSKDDSNPQIERMWALHRVERLMGENRSNGGTKHRDEIVQLCEGYSITSEFASFIVLENDAEYRRWKIDRRNATRVVRDRQAQTAVREQLAQLRRQTAEKVGPRVAQKAPANGTKTESLAASPSESAGPSITGPRSDVSSSFTGFDPIETRVTVTPSDDTRRGFEISSNAGNRDGAGGGGAIDPLTALVAAGLAGIGFACRHRRVGESPRP
jgi:Ca-activated chloride channel family protein